MELVNSGLDNKDFRLYYIIRGYYGWYSCKQAESDIIRNEKIVRYLISINFGSFIHCIEDIFFLQIVIGFDLIYIFSIHPVPFTQ